MPDSERLILNLDAPVGAPLDEILRAVADDAADGEGSGYARLAGGASVGWRTRRPGDGVPLDVRQRDAAAELLMGFDLPAPMELACVNMLEAADVRPGLLASNLDGRRSRLERARALIDEMLLEPDA